MKLGDVARTKDKYSRKGEVIKIGVDNNSPGVQVNWFSGTKSWEYEEDLDILTGLDAVKPGDVIVSRSGRIRKIENVIGDRMLFRFQVSLLSIKDYKEEGWTIKQPESAWHDITEDEYVWKMQAWVWNDRIEDATPIRLFGFFPEQPSPYLHRNTIPYKHASKIKPTEG